MILCLSKRKEKEIPTFPCFSYAERDMIFLDERMVTLMNNTDYADMKVVTLYIDNYPAYRAMGAKAMGTAILNLFAFIAGEELSKMDSMTNACFALLLTDFQRECKKYKAIVETRRIRAKQGAEARWGKSGNPE